jgi:hypothetical protein
VKLNPGGLYDEYRGTCPYFLGYAIYEKGGIVQKREMIGLMYPE